MVTNLANDLVNGEKSSAIDRQYGHHDSWVLSEESQQTRDLATVLTSKLLTSNVDGFSKNVSAAVELSLIHI